MKSHSQIISITVRSYDKLILLTVMLILAGSVMALGMLTGTMQSRLNELRDAVDNIQPEYPVVEPVSKEKLAGTIQNLRSPLLISGMDQWLFEPEARLSCETCRALIPLDGYELRKPCPYCGVLPPPPPPDRDNDGILDKWEIQYGLNPDFAGDAQLDPDQDGFSNLEEYKYNKSPKDRNESPLADNLYLDRIGSVPFPIVFQSMVKLADGSRTFGLNAGGKTYFVKQGDVVRGYRVIEFKELKDNHSPVLVLDNGVRQVKLVQHEKHRDYHVRIRFAMDGSFHEAGLDKDIQIRNRNLTVRHINPVYKTAVLHSADTDRDYMLRTRPADK